MGKCLFGTIKHSMGSNSKIFLNIEVSPLSDRNGCVLDLLCSCASIHWLLLMGQLPKCNRPLPILDAWKPMFLFPNSFPEFSQSPCVSGVTVLNFCFFSSLWSSRVYPVQIGFWDENFCMEFFRHGVESTHSFDLYCD